LGCVARGGPQAADIDFATTDALELFALSAAILALGGVFWLVRDQDRRERPGQVERPAT